MRTVARQLSQSSSGGFTLAELLLAITILTFLAGITVGTLKSAAAGNRRVACATNLRNLHQAIRMYRLDEGQYPAFNPANSDPGPGLWALFTYYRDPATPGSRLPTSAPKTGYVGSPKSLHCPEDRAHLTYTNPAPGMDAFYYDDPSTGDTFLSYQVADGSEYTYLPDRGAGTNTRQLQPTGTGSSWHPDADTVVTWCKWHRSKSKPRDYDLILFLDGQVDFKPMPDGVTPGWQRTPVVGTVE